MGLNPMQWMFKEGYIYAVRSEDWERLVERAHVATDEPLESSQVTPCRERNINRKSSYFR